MRELIFHLIHFAQPPEDTYHRGVVQSRKGSNMFNSQNCPPLCTSLWVTFQHVYIAITTVISTQFPISIYFFNHHSFGFLHWSYIAVHDAIAVQVCVYIYTVMCLILIVKTILFGSQQTKIIYTNIVTVKNFCNHYLEEREFYGTNYWIHLHISRVLHCVDLTCSSVAVK